MRAVANVRKFCERELVGAYDLEVVDLYDSPERAQPANIVAAPTLIRAFGASAFANGSVLTTPIRLSFQRYALEMQAAKIICAS